jgi:hypothetical protein
VLGALAVHWLTTIRRPPRWDRRFWIPYGAAGLLLATWIGFALTASSRQNVGHLSARLLAGFPYYLGQIDAYVLPLPYLLTLGALLIGRPTVGSTAGAPRGHDTPAGADAGGNHADGRRAAFLLAFVVLGGLAGASLAPSRWMRYVFCVVPVVLGLAAQGLVALAEGRRWGRWVAAVLVLAMVSSSVPFVLSHALLATLARASGAITVRDRTVDYRVPLWQLFQEFRDPPHGPVAAVVAYLREHARPGDAIVATYGELPLKFHTTLEVWGGETGQLPPPHVSVEWIWQRDFAGPLYDQVRDSVDWVDRQLAQGAYHRIELPAIDRRWENREDPSVHIFSNPGPDGPPVILHAPRQPPRP